MSIMGLVEVIKIPLWPQRASEFLKQGTLMKQVVSKHGRSHLRTRFRQSAMLIVAVLLLTSGLGYRFYHQPKLDVDTVAPHTIVAPSSASIEDVETTEKKDWRLEVGCFQPSALIQKPINK